MGWSYGHDNNGREIGYAVDAVCDGPGCETKIDRGLAYRCGPLGAETGGDGPGCGGYFCVDDLVYSEYAKHGSLCVSCADMADDRATHPDCELCRDGEHLCPKCGERPTFHDDRYCPTCDPQATVRSLLVAVEVELAYVVKIGVGDGTDGRYDSAAVERIHAHLLHNVRRAQRVAAAELVSV